MKIDWKLLDNGEIVIDEVDKLTKFENNTIYYEDEYGIHVVDRTNRIYERRCPDDTFRVDFKNNLLTVSFGSNNLKYDIKTNYEEKDELIILTYELGNEQKQIIIKRKEEIWKIY